MRLKTKRKRKKAKRWKFFTEAENEIDEAFSKIDGKGEFGVNNERKLNEHVNNEKRQN